MVIVLIVYGHTGHSCAAIPNDNSVRHYYVCCLVYYWHFRIEDTNVPVVDIVDVTGKAVDVALAVSGVPIIVDYTGVALRILTTWVSLFKLLYLSCIYFFGDSTKEQTYLEKKRNHYKKTGPLK